MPVTTSKNAALALGAAGDHRGFVFQSTGLGLRLRGSREDDIAARSLGIGVRTERRVAWVVQAFIMGVGGGAVRASTSARSTRASSTWR